MQSPDRWPLHFFTKDSGTHILNPNNWVDHFELDPSSNNMPPIEPDPSTCQVMVKNCGGPLEPEYSPYLTSSNGLISVNTALPWDKE